VGIHYLGHAAFVLRFGEAPTVVTDYGAPNAWAAWGWDSPIHELGGVVPDLLTCSHTHHEDHYDPSRIPTGSGRVWASDEALRVGELEVAAIPMHEQALDDPDNRAYLFTWRGVRVLHLGDCQADILHIRESEIQRRLRRILPSRCDLVLLPIESQQRLCPQAAALLLQLQPACAVPMHYWSQETLESFLEAAAAAPSVRVRREDRPQLWVPIDASGEGTWVVPLHPAPFRGWRRTSGATVAIDQA
jgi:L-ascorbate metabolism protein UlaG (beta-lactamase superfamily)